MISPSSLLPSVRLRPCRGRLLLLLRPPALSSAAHTQAEQALVFSPRAPFLRRLSVYGRPPAPPARPDRPLQAA